MDPMKVDRRYEPRMIEEDHPMIKEGDLQMSFVLDCPACRKAVTATQEHIGRVMACPHCSRHFTIPREGAAPISVSVPVSNYPSDTAKIRFTFSCQRCSSILEARGDMGGQQGRCPTCGAVFIIPQVNPQTGLPVGPAVVEADGQLPTPMHAYATAGEKAPTITRLEDGQQVILCPRCQRQMPVEIDTCTACGMPFTMEGAAAISYSGPNSNGLATAALTLGIISLFTFCAPILGLVAIGLGIAGLRRSERLGQERRGRSMAIAGILCGVISLGLFAVFILLN